MNEKINDSNGMSQLGDLLGYGGLHDLSGSGVVVGIISSDLGLSSDIAKDVLDGELSSIRILKDIPNDSIFSTGEGRALAQVLYDVAPEAEVLFHTAIGGDGSSFDNLNQNSFSTAVRALKDAGADIIFDDIAGLEPSLYRDGIAAQAVEEAVEEGVVYLSAAGNNGAISYESQFRPEQELEIAGLSFIAHDFDPTEGVDLFQNVSIGEKGAILKPLLSWESEQGSNSNSELFLFVLDSPELPSEDNVLSFSVVPSDLKLDEDVSTSIYLAEPFQELYYTIASTTGPSIEQPHRLKWVSTSNGSDRGVTYEYVDPLLGLPTIFGPANSESAITVGSANDEGTKYDDFASRGSIPALFDKEGNPLSEPIIRQKPDIIGRDNVMTAFPEGSQFNPFIGTSAAVADVAGIVALMEQAAGGPDVLSPETIKFILGATDRPVEPAPGLPPSAGVVQPDLAVFGAKIAGKIASFFPNAFT